MNATVNAIQRVDTGKGDYKGDPIALYWDVASGELSDFGQTNAHVRGISHFEKNIHTYRKVIEACGFIIRDEEIIAPANDEQTIRIFTALIRQIYWGLLTENYQNYQQRLQR